MSSGTSVVSAHRGRRLRVLRGAARLLAALALAVNAYVHADLAPRYDLVGDNISQGTLFRAEAGLSALAALLVLIWHRLVGDLFTWIVAAGSLALLFVYRYVDVGTLGPFPNMYEPRWYDEKFVAVVALALAVLATVFLLLTHRWRRGRGVHAGLGNRRRRRGEVS
ncbi:hypothetical protein [Streptomyces lushanensis]|uniref:hypothetical protein n=1 Tax=Streptomyces lushanensis TaxID=1434255 RepID=UPI00083522CF|nr:hypothetical protein [Streptomyces lushanensis]